ncbi:bacterial alpha-L-rhamnosidase domain protein [Marssonina coronariae]|uniref:Bacterial alpha-L-rhamnosidase domain protein n=1 Tax=Diplocarpon coronariae TaxID=2795749 RepID=A0A218Z0G7_9HELO|nr:bacterial alpha-L-rhamnosidase domain protein [Marssonina coronariae]
MRIRLLVQALALALFSRLICATATSATSLATDGDRASNLEDLVAYRLPDGRRRIDFYDNGVLEGYALETDEGATFFDADGSGVNLDDENGPDINKRISKWKLALKFAKLIAKWGKKAWDYIYCVGADTVWKCADDVSYPLD